MSNKNVIKLIGIDLDGTLLSTDHLISEKNRQAITRAQEKGIQIVLCTGRPLRSMKHFLNEIDLLNEDDLVVTYNGGLIQKSKTGEILKRSMFNKKELIDIYELSVYLEFPISLISLYNIYEPPAPDGIKSKYGRNDIGIPKKNALSFFNIVSSDLSDDLKIQSIVISRPKEEINKIIERIPMKYFKKYNIYRSHDHILEMLPKNVDKGYAINYIQKILKLKKHQIMGIGDQENDLSLIKNSGIGIAMENASEDVKKAADYITASNNNHGVAQAIETFIL